MVDLLPTNPYRGTRDFLPEEMAIRQEVFAKLYKTAEVYGFQRYDGPLLESADIYEAKSGREIADQQLYSLTDRSGRRLALRPEMTPSAARIVARFADQLEFPLRWYCHVNCHRYERPQRGRVREHWQLNCDIFGADDVSAELEIFDLVHALFRSLGAARDDYTLRANCRVITESAMRRIVGVSDDSLPMLFRIIDRWQKISEDDRIVELTSIGLGDRQIDRLMQVLSADNSLIDELPSADLAKSNLAKILKGRDKDLVLFDPLIIRAFEYYTSTVFEVFDNDPINQRSLFGGGRYQNLAALFTDKNISGIGFGMGDVTTLDFLNTHLLLPTPRIGSDVTVIPATPNIADSARDIARLLRSAGVKTVFPLNEKSLSSEMKRAARNDSRIVVVIGAQEWQRGAVTVRDMFTREQAEIPIDGIVFYVKDLLTNQSN